MNHIHDEANCPDCRSERRKAIWGIVLLIALVVGSLFALSRRIG